MKRILVLGYFGYLTNQLDGQTVKTRDIYRLVTDKSAEAVGFFDTENFKKNIFSVFKMFYLLVKCRTLLYIPAHNNLKFIFPAIFLLSFIFRFKINYFVVGGWLVGYLKNKHLHCLFLRHINGIFTETNLMKCELEKNYNMSNVVVFPNFRIHDFRERSLSQSESLRIVFMSRINKLKGLDIVFLIAEYIKNNGLDIIIDFYGPINLNDKSYFDAEIAKYEFTHYFGVLEPDKINSTLCGYDLLILPTRYFTEGFPGAILDAYISGIPVLVSQWKHATEFVENGVTGYICPLEDPSRFTDIVVQLFKDRELLSVLKKNARSKSDLYSADVAWETMCKYI